MATSENVLAQVIGQVSYTDLCSLIEYVNEYVRYQKCDIEVRISFVESPAKKGEYLTRPVFNGGPGCLVRFVIPTEKVEQFHKYLRDEDWYLFDDMQVLK